MLPFADAAPVVGVRALRPLRHVPIVFAHRHIIFFICGVSVVSFATFRLLSEPHQSDRSSPSLLGQKTPQVLWVVPVDVDVTEVLAVAFAMMFEVLCGSFIVALFIPVVGAVVAAAQFHPLSSVVAHDP